MRQFIKFFFASFLSVLLLAILGIFFIGYLLTHLTSSAAPPVGAKGVLYIDLSQTLNEQVQDNPLPGLGNDDNYDTPGLYDMVRLINYAKTDSAIKGIYLKCADNNNGFASSDELRNALQNFKTSKKFIYAYADAISQRAYYIANIADKIYCNPKGGLEWKGFSLQYMFFKQTLDKLGIEPQVFYAGKFKSATEPFRTDKMSDANRLQSAVFLNDLYSRFLIETAAARQVDTATLHRYADAMTLQTAEDG
ncbi:MAG TPA: S49 family peptidase, partial [Chitinophagaceae bacterium]|nr:S49 family peptidase [Chitinophagaceae bacterium]